MTDLAAPAETTETKRTGFRAEFVLAFLLSAASLKAAWDGYPASR